MLKKLQLIILTMIIVTSCTTKAEYAPINVSTGNNWQQSMDYTNPDLYKENGVLTSLSKLDAGKIKKRLGNNRDYALITAAWYFKNSLISEVKPSGANHLGGSLSKDIMNSGIITTSHDEAMVMASILRVMDLPVIMIDVVNVDWAKEYAAGETTFYMAGIFLEVFVDNRWILMNPSTGEYIKKYDPENPSFMIKNSRSSNHYYTLFKGIDPLEYGVETYEDLKDHCVLFANSMEGYELVFYVPEVLYLTDYLIDNYDDFYRSYEVDITLNYQYTGQYTIDRDHFLWVNVDRFTNGHPITSTKVYKPEGTLHFKGIRTVLPEVYIVGGIDIDRSGWSSYGDPEMVYTDEFDKKAPVDISNGPITIDITFDDSIRNGY